MKERILTKQLKDATRYFPVITVTGPRQSGKTTLVKTAFPDYYYVSLELPDQRTMALEDPRGFLARFDGPVILDEVQRTPELFSYIQVLVDENPDWAGRFILTGSQNFLLAQSISQSLAGRTAVFHLLPFSLAELQSRPQVEPEDLNKVVRTAMTRPERGLMETMFTGFYPRIHDKGIPPKQWLAGYLQTYVERDVRNIINIGDIESFGRFVRLCAGRSGQLLNLSGLAADCGISHTTARRWISVLESSFIITLLRPYHRNFGKRMIKSPKLYFLDTGLLCYLLRVDSPQALFHRAERGAIFETLIVSELYKNFLNRGVQPSLYFWRDSQGHEVDILIDLGDELIPIEVKSGQTVNREFFKNLVYLQGLSMGGIHGGVLVYGGDEAWKHLDVVVRPWFAV